MYYVYIIQSKNSDRYYVGYSCNVQRRLEEHNSGKARSTSPNKPWKLVFTRECESKRYARQLELKIKRMKSHTFIERLIRNEISESFYEID